MKQVIHYLKGTSKSQDFYAEELETTEAGTDMSLIPGVLNSYSGKKYVYDKIGTSANWISFIKAGIQNQKPSILDIDTRKVSAFPYNTSGHFVNTSGTSTAGGHFRIRITDPYGPGLGNRWYYSNDLYNANNNHFRKAIIH